MVLIFNVSKYSFNSLSIFQNFPLVPKIFFIVGLCNWAVIQGHVVSGGDVSFNFIFTSTGPFFMILT